MEPILLFELHPSVPIDSTVFALRFQNQRTLTKSNFHICSPLHGQWNKYCFLNCVLPSQLTPLDMLTQPKGCRICQRWANPEIWQHWMFLTRYSYSTCPCADHNKHRVLLLNNFNRHPLFIWLQTALALHVLKDNYDHIQNIYSGRSPMCAIHCQPQVQHHDICIIHTYNAENTVSLPTQRLISELKLLQCTLVTYAPASLIDAVYISPTVDHSYQEL